MPQASDPTATGMDLNLLALPDEIIDRIFRFLSPQDNLLSLQQVCKRISHLANGHLLWRFHCLSNFSYWHPKHSIEKKVARRINETDWKGLYRLRVTSNRKIAAIFKDVVAGYDMRFARVREIASYGYDAKDFLLTHCRADPLSGDGLARSFHSDAILGSIHREIAIKEWLLSARGEVTADRPTSARQLERAIGAYDLFVLNDRPGDLDQISSMLDQLASDFRKAHRNHDRMTTRQKALTLLRWLRSSSLVGLRDIERSDDLIICLLGQTLRDEEHGSNATVSAIIFCSVASRLDLDAHCCEPPLQVYAVVRPPRGLTLDGWPADPEQQAKSQSHLIFFPFGHDDPVSESSLSKQLLSTGFDNMTVAPLLKPLSSARLAFKAAITLKLTASRILRSSRLSPRPVKEARLLGGNDNRNLRACQYAAEWAELAMTNHRTDLWAQELAGFVEKIMNYWPEDVWIVEEHLLPLYREVDPVGAALTAQTVNNFVRTHPRQTHTSLGFADAFWSLDDAESRAHLPFKIGQVFRHKRLNWYGVILAWYEKGTQVVPQLDQSGRLVDMTFRRTVPPDDPPLGNRLFFRCQPSVQIEPFISRPENMELVTDSSLITMDMFPIAGHYFSRFDEATCTFVSRVREQL